MLTLEDDKDSYLSRIRAQYDSFSKSQKKIAAFLSENPDAVLNNSITSLSKKIGTTPPSLTRFCQLLHYKGFSDLKFCMEKQISCPFGKEREILPSDAVESIRQKLLSMDVQAVTGTLLQVDGGKVRMAAEAICKAGSVLVYADGNNSSSAAFAYHALLQMGIPCHLFSDFPLAKMTARKMRKNDVLIGITFSGNSTTVVSVVEEALARGATIVGITASANSRLAKEASILLSYSPHIGDDLRYLHIARMCEIALIGLLQSTLFNILPQSLRENVELSRKSISAFRVK